MKQRFADQLIDFSQSVGIGDDKGFNPGSFRVVCDLLEEDFNYLLLLKIWYWKKKQEPEWKEFFEEYKTGWLWVIYKDKNQQDIKKLCQFFQGVSLAA